MARQECRAYIIDITKAAPYLPQPMCPIPFHAFNPRKAVCTYRTHMPHWRQDGATYYVTFRLADSMPKHLTESWKSELVSWLKANGITYDPKTWREEIKTLPPDIRQAYARLAGSKLDKYLDKGEGSCVLKQSMYAQHVSDALQHFHGDRLECGDFVIMPNHVHWLVRPNPEYELDDLLKSVKGHSAFRINRQLGRKGRLWQQGSYDHIVRDLGELFHYCGYIKRNPSAASKPYDQILLHKAEWLLP